MSLWGVVIAACATLAGLVMSWVFGKKSGRKDERGRQVEENRQASEQFRRRRLVRSTEDDRRLKEIAQEFEDRVRDLSRDRLRELHEATRKDEP